MLTELEIHKALLAVLDREYRFVLDLCERKGFQLPLQGPIAYRLLEQEAHANNAESQFAVAKLLGAGVFVRRDKVRSYEWCEKSANAGFAPALTMLGNIYESGWGILPADPSKVMELWRSAAAKDEPGALSAIAEYGLSGRANEIGRDDAVNLLRRAACAGDALAQCRLGLVLVAEESSASKSQGLSFLRSAAEKAVSTAHRQLAHFLRNGLHGLEVDEVTADRHLRAASTIDDQFE
jgi:TPR repeat protein